MFTVEAPREADAIALATGYAKAFRAAIPDDRGLPVRGRGARAAQRELGPLGWAGLGAFAGLAVGIALTGQERAQARIRASTSSRFSRMCSSLTTDSRLSRSSGSVFEGRTLKCQSS